MLRTNSTCDEGSNPTIQLYFGDCCYDGRDLVGFALGMASILCWLLCSFPQLVTNYRLKRADALSPFFLAQWLLGDTANLLGALLKGDQPQTVVLTAQYFICMDCVLLLQYLYYTSLARRRERTYLLARRREQQRQQRQHHRHHHHQPSHTHGHSQAILRSRAQSGSEQQQQEGDASGFPEIVTAPGEGEGAPGGSGSAVVVGGAGAGRKVRAAAAAAAAGTLLLVHGPQQALADHAPLRRLLAAGAVAYTQQPWMSSVGAALGYVSCLFYLSSRASQIWKNHMRRSVEGLAPLMFMCAISANLLYGAALLLRSRGAEELLSSLPWLLGSLGTVALDAAILTQGVVYGVGVEDKKNGSDEEEALLDSTPPPSLGAEEPRAREP